MRYTQISKGLYQISVIYQGECYSELVNEDEIFKRALAMSNELRSGCYE